MQELEKILEEMRQIKDGNRKENLYAKYPPNGKDQEVLNAYSQGYEDGTDNFYNAAAEIIRKHMNDGWIPVEKEFPPLGQRLQATILHHEWVSDYDSSWVPDDEKVYHPAYTEVCEIYSVGAMWYYACAENDYLCDVAYVFPLKVLSNPVAEIIAWKQYPEPYRPEQPETCKYTGGSYCWPIDQCRECPNHPERSDNHD